MPSKLLKKMHLDPNALSGDLKRIANFPFNDSYKEFICGVWKSCVIWNQSGLTETPIISNYEGNAKPTPLAKQLTYLNQVLASVFNTQYIKYVRLVILGANSVVVPHRDYLELKSNFSRFHIPLVTNKHCYNSEEDHVYHLAEGEIWYLDATLVHSAACLDSTLERLHLIIDFDCNIPMDRIFKTSVKELPLHHHEMKRAPLTTAQLTAINSLSHLINHTNFYDIIAILVKLHFYHQINASFALEKLLQITKDNADNSLVTRAISFANYCITARSNKPEQLLTATQPCPQEMIY